MNHSPRTPKRAAIFDLDGTLFDSMPFVVENFIYAMEPFRERPSVAEVLACLGGPVDVCLRNLLGARADASLAPAKERLLAYEHDNDAKLKPFEGAAELVGSLHARGVRLGIWTARDRFSTEKILKRHPFSAHFSAIVCGDDLPSHKPDPAGLIRAVALAGATASETVFMGDADADVLGGHAAGIHTIFVHHGREAPAHIHSRAAEVYAVPAEAYAALARHFI